MNYILDISKLKPCDVILTRNKQLPSKAVRFFSAGAYSHALCCLSETSLIEATVEGRVFTENTQRMLFKNIDDCKVLRLKKELNQENKAKIINFLRTKITTRYSIAEAIRTARYGRTDKLAQENGQFCSRLVAQSFIEIGISLVNNPNYCSPENLNSSVLLEAIPNAMRKVNSEDIKFFETKSQIKENQIQNYIWLDKVAELAKKEKFNILSQNDVGQFLIDYRQYDEEVCKYIKETTYLTQYKQDEEIHPPRYQYFPNACIDIFKEFSVNHSLLKHRMINYSVFSDLYKKFNLNYFLLSKNLREEMLQQLNTRLETLKLYTEKTSNEYQFLLISAINDLQSQIKECFYKSDLLYK